MRAITDIEIEAARDLGASRWRLFDHHRAALPDRHRRRLRIPFLLTSGDWVTPDPGRRRMTMLGNLIAAAVRRVPQLAARRRHVVQPAGGRGARHRRLRRADEAGGAAMRRASPLWWLLAAACSSSISWRRSSAGRLFAFTNRASPISRSSLSLQWWREMLAHPQFLPSLRAAASSSACTTAVVSAVVGTMAASGSRRCRAARLLDPRALSLPVMLPPLVLAVALVTFFVSLGVKLSLVTVTISHVLLTQPFVILDRLCAACAISTAHDRERARPRRQRLDARSAPSRCRSSARPSSARR